MSAPLFAHMGASPRAKLLLAAGLVLLLALLTPGAGAHPVALARGVLGVGVVAGLGWWWARGRARGPAFALDEPLKILARKGLSPRCTVALVQAEGRRFLVTYGDAFAQVQAMPPPRRRAPRRVVRRQVTSSSGVLQ